MSDICINASVVMSCMYVLHACMQACMHVRMYVCMYICMYVGIYASMYVCMYLCTHVSMCMCACVCIEYIHTYLEWLRYVRIYKYRHVNYFSAHLYIDTLASYI